MKKKIIAVLLSSIMTVSITACGGVLDVASDMMSAETNKEQDTEVLDDEDSYDLDLEDVISDSLEDEEDADSFESEEDAEVEEEVSADSEGTLTFTVPEGFVYDEANELYNSPDSLGNIIYMTMDNDGSLAFITQSMMETGLEATLTNQFDTEVDINFDSWEDVTVGGYDAIRYTISYEVMGISVIQTQIIVDGTEKLHYLTFTEMNNAGYLDDFAACEASAKFEK